MAECPVCNNAKNAQPHFGGISCRACAAFFRRYVHSPKRSSTLCSCDVEIRKSLDKTPHPCRKCRIEKCLAIGMQKDKVQPCREKNQLDKKPKNELALIPSTSLTNQYRITNRGTYKIFETLSKWTNVHSQRMKLYGEDPDRLNFYELSCLTRTDSMIVWPAIEELFPVIRSVKQSDKEALLANFMAKHIFIESSIVSPLNVTWFKEPSVYLQDTPENNEMLVNFYGNAMPEEHRLSRADLIQVFEPFWKYFYERIMIPIHEKQFDMIECIAHLLLILFDHAYINITEECAEHCRALRNIVLRELRGYHMDKNRPESRFFEVLESLLLVERADEKFQKEIQICELYNVRIHEDYRLLITDVNKI